VPCMKAEAISEEFKQLPPEGQRAVIDFIAFLRQRYKTAERSRQVKRQLREDPFIGMWKDREDLKDTTSWVRTLREREWP